MRNFVPGFALILSPESGLNFSTSPQQQMSTLLFLSTLAIALGKLTLGPVIDKFGGIMSLKALHLSLSVLLVSIGSVKSVTLFAICWVLVDLGFSSCWPSCLASVHQAFQPNLWTKKIGLLAMAARTGNATAFFIFGALLQCFQNRPNAWRFVFWVSAALQIVPLVLLNSFSKDVGDDACFVSTRYDVRADQAGDSMQRSPFQVLRKEVKCVDFWLQLVSRSALMVFGSFLLFVPTFMIHCYSMSTDNASRVGSLFAIGCMLSLSLGSNIYSSLPLPRRISAITMLLLLSVFCSVAQLIHVAGIITLSPLLGAMMMMLWGFSFSIPFYVPPALFSLSRGGKESSATIADFFDVFGFGILSFFNGYVASFRHDIITNWVFVFKLLSCCAVASLVTLPTAIWIGHKSNPPEST